MTCLAEYALIMFRVLDSEWYEWEFRQGWLNEYISPASDWRSHCVGTITRSDKAEDGPTWTLRKGIQWGIWRLSTAIVYFRLIFYINDYLFSLVWHWTSEAIESRARRKALHEPEDLSHRKGINNISATWLKRVRRFVNVFFRMSIIVNNRRIIKYCMIFVLAHVPWPSWWNFMD